MHIDREEVENLIWLLAETQRYIQHLLDCEKSEDVAQSPNTRPEDAHPVAAPIVQDIAGVDWAARKEETDRIAMSAMIEVHRRDAEARAKRRVIRHDNSHLTPPHLRQPATNETGKAATQE